MSDVFVTVGLGGKGVYLLGFSPSEAEGQTKGVDRMGIDGAQCDKHTTLLIDGTMGFRLQGWLREQGLSAEDAFGAVRSVVIQIARLCPMPQLR